MREFQVIDVTEWPAVGAETLGSKEKAWLGDPASPADHWLWKATRTDAGDDWAEKAAEQLAKLLRVPHATVELATRSNARGVIVRDFRQRAGATIGSFTPGNELLWNVDVTYPRELRRNVSKYTVARALSVLRASRVSPPATGVHWGEAFPAAHFFVGYLLLDAWIGNQDRHHENWGVILPNPGASNTWPSLGPSFDHGSSLAQNETDEKRERRMETRDQRAVLKTWIRKARTPFFASESAADTVTTFEAFELAATEHPEARALWIQRLRAVDERAVETVFAALPVHCLSSLGRRFTLRVLDANRELLLDQYAS